MNFKPSFGKVFSNRAFTGAAIFVIFLYLLEEFVFGFPLLQVYQITLIFRPPDEKLAMAAAAIQEQPAAIQLRYLQTLVEIGSEQTTTIVFPLPIDLITSMKQVLNGAKRIATTAV